MRGLPGLSLRSNPGLGLANAFGVFSKRIPAHLIKQHQFNSYETAPLAESGLRV